MKLHFSFRTTEFENEYDDICDILDGLKNIHKLNSCNYYGKEILVYHEVMIPGSVYTGKIFYDIIFEEDPKNVFIERCNDTDGEMLTGISKKGIELFNNFNMSTNNDIIAPSVYDIFIDAEDINNEIYGFCVHNINFDQILEINIMFFNGEDSEVLKHIYKR